MLDCIILAGGVNADLEKLEGISNKALIKIGKKEMVRYVLEAFRQVEAIERLALVGPVDKFAFLQNDFSVELVPESTSILDNLLAANRLLNTQKPLIICTADIPLISPPVVKDFIQQCLPFDFDFYYPIVSKEKSEERFPGVKRTYVNLKEGIFTGGNMFLVNSSKIEHSVPSLRKFIEFRKKPLKMVSLLGVDFVMQALTKRLTIRELEMRFSRLLNLKAKAIISDYPEIGFDMDKPNDLHLMREIISRQQN